MATSRICICICKNENNDLQFLYDDVTDVSSAEDICNGYENFSFVSRYMHMRDELIAIYFYTLNGTNNKMQDISVVKIMNCCGDEEMIQRLESIYGVYLPNMKKLNIVDGITNQSMQLINSVLH